MLVRGRQNDRAQRAPSRATTSEGPQPFFGIFGDGAIPSFQSRVGEILRNILPWKSGKRDTSRLQPVVSSQSPPLISHPTAFLTPKMSLLKRPEIHRLVFLPCAFATQEAFFSCWNSATWLLWPCPLKAHELYPYRQNCTADIYATRTADSDSCD